MRIAAMDCGAIGFVVKFPPSIATFRCAAEEVFQFIETSLGSRMKLSGADQ
jgi:hypothetical protein